MRLNKRFVALAALVGAIAALSMVASAAITTTINPAAAPTRGNGGFSRKSSPSDFLRVRVDIGTTPSTSFSLESALK